MAAKLSLEAKLILLFAFSVLLLLIPCIYIIIDLQLDMLEGLTVLLLIVLPGYWIFSQCYKYITDVLDRIGLQLDSIGNEEFNSWHLAGFHGGRIDSLKQDFAKLSKKLSDKRFEYMHNEAFLFEFIKDIKLPILVLDHHQQIYSCNDSFNHLTKLTESNLLGKKVATLGIEFINHKWQQAKESVLTKRYEVTPHLIKRSGRNYQLLVLFSIEQQLRDNEKQVWQRLIRVLNHEVRNSLTPIYSMTQSLQEMKLSGSLNANQIALEKNILQTIEKRSLQLLDFVDNYSAFSKLAAAKMLPILSDEINKRIQAIFPTLQIQQPHNLPIIVDAGQLEQTLINLIKNAFEANAIAAAVIENKQELPPATISVMMIWQQTQQNTTIEIIDSGLGIANPDNLFVPFYSTKDKGTGIGLILSRELIRNQGGELTLNNRIDAQGAVAKISLIKQHNHCR